MPPQQLDGNDPNKAAQLAQLLQYGGMPAAGATPPASAIAPQGTFGQPMGPVSTLDQQLQQLIAQGSQMGLKQEPEQLARAQGVASQTAPLLAQQAAQAQNVPQMPGPHFRPVHGIGDLFYDIGQGAIGLGMATRPGQIIREQMYEQRLAPWEEKNRQLASAITSSQAQQQTEQQPLGTEAGLIYHPMMAGGEGMRGEGAIAEALVNNVRAGTDYQRMIQNWTNLSLKERGQDIDKVIAQIHADATVEAARTGIPIAQIMAGVKQNIANLEAASAAQKDPSGPVWSAIDNALAGIMGTTPPVTAPQIPGAASPTGAQVPVSPGNKPAPAKNKGPAIGTVRMINGQQARWDGKGWLPTGSK